MKGNSTLRKLDLNSLEKRMKKNKECESAIVVLFSGDKIGDQGVMALCDSLKTNTSLLSLDLCRKNKEKKK